MRMKNHSLNMPHIYVVYVHANLNLICPPSRHSFGYMDYISPSSPRGEPLINYATSLCRVCTRQSELNMLPLETRPAIWIISHPAVRVGNHSIIMPNCHIAHVHVNLKLFCALQPIAIGTRNNLKLFCLSDIIRVLVKRHRAATLGTQLR